MEKKLLRTVRARQVTVFKIRNRKGYAAVCFCNLTEGKSVAEALSRLRHPLRRMGYALGNKSPKALR